MGGREATNLTMTACGKGGKEDDDADAGGPPTLLGSVEGCIAILQSSGTWWHGATLIVGTQAHWEEEESQRGVEE